MGNFIEDYWEKNGHLWGGELITRFPPEPNGALHIGHVFIGAESILLVENQRLAMS